MIETWMENCLVSDSDCNIVNLAWYLWKHHMVRKIVTNVAFSNTRKVGLNWSLEATFANYISMYVQNARSMCNQYQGKESFHIMHVVSFIVTSITLDSNQSTTIMTLKDFICILLTCTISAHTKSISKYRLFQSWSSLHKTRNWIGLE